MKIVMIDHETMEVEAESVSDHAYLLQFHNGIMKILPPKPFEHNVCKLELTVKSEGKVEKQLGI